VFPAGRGRAERVDLALAELVPELLAGLPAAAKPPSILPISMLPVPVVTAGSSAGCRIPLHRRAAVTMADGAVLAGSGSPVAWRPGAR